MNRPALTRRTPAVGDSGSAAAAVRPLRVLPLALFALMVPSYLLRGYFAPAFRNPGYGGIAVEVADRMLSELAVRGHLEVSLKHGGIPYAFGSATLPHKGCGLPTS